MLETLENAEGFVTESCGRVDGHTYKHYRINSWQWRHGIHTSGISDSQMNKKKKVGKDENNSRVQSQKKNTDL